MLRIEMRGSGLGATRDTANVLIRHAIDFHKRRAVKARSALYQAGEPASNYYLVESGTLGLYHPEKGRHRPVCFVRSGDLFSFNCGKLHALSCEAVADSTVLMLDSATLHSAAVEAAEVAVVLEALHADELAMILRTLPRPRLARWSADDRHPPVAQRNGAPDAAMGSLARVRRQRSPRLNAIVAA